MVDTPLKKGFGVIWFAVNGYETNTKLLTLVVRVKGSKSAVDLAACLFGWRLVPFWVIATILCVSGFLKD